MKFSKPKDVGEIPHPAQIPERLNLPVAESLDVQRVAGHEMPENFDGLMRAAQRVDTGARPPPPAEAPPRSRPGTAPGTGMARAGRTGREINRCDPRIDIPGTTHPNPVAETNVRGRGLSGGIAGRIQTTDEVIVVQSDVGDLHAADKDRSHPGDRRQRPGAADLNFDGKNLGHRLFRRKSQSHRPARGPLQRAQSRLPVQPLDLEHCAVDLERPSGPLRQQLS